MAASEGGHDHKGFRFAVPRLLGSFLPLDYVRARLFRHDAINSKASLMRSIRS